MTHNEAAHQPIVCTYRRVSTEQQYIENQDRPIREYLEKRGWHADYNISDEISGSTPWRNRALAGIFNTNPRATQLICYELSRLGRSRMDVLDFLENCNQQSIAVHIISCNLDIDQSMGSKVITTMLSLSAELERDFLRARTIEGLNRARLAGRKLGRPPGKMTTHQLDAKAGEIRRMLQLEVPKTTIAKLASVSRSTIHRYLKSCQLNQK